MKEEEPATWILQRQPTNKEVDNQTSGRESGNNDTSKAISQHTCFLSQCCPWWYLRNVVLQTLVTQFWTIPRLLWTPGRSWRCPCTRNELRPSLLHQPRAPGCNKRTVCKCSAVDGHSLWRLRAKINLFSRIWIMTFKMIETISGQMSRKQGSVCPESRPIKDSFLFRIQLCVFVDLLHELYLSFFFFFFLPFWNI